MDASYGASTSGRGYDMPWEKELCIHASWVGNRRNYRSGNTSSARVRPLTDDQLVDLGVDLTRPGAPPRGPDAPGGGAAAGAYGQPAAGSSTSRQPAAASSSQPAAGWETMVEGVRRGSQLRAASDAAVDAMPEFKAFTAQNARPYADVLLEQSAKLHNLLTTYGEDAVLIGMLATPKTVGGWVMMSK
jgi:hypothetical protein